MDLIPIICMKKLGVVTSTYYPGAGLVETGGSLQVPSGSQPNLFNELQADKSPDLNK